MPNYSNVGCATSPDIEYVITDNVVVEGDVAEAASWGEAFIWYGGGYKTPKIAKDLKELLGEPDWEI